MDDKRSAPPSRRRDLDLMRVGSMAAVVFLHVAASSLRESPSTLTWNLANLFASLGSAAVPLFFMLSGHLLLSSEKTADPRFLFTHRLPKIALPALVWSLTAVVYFYVTEGLDAALQKLLTMPTYSVLIPYWFLYALIPMYLLSPLLRLLTQQMEELHWRYVLGLWLVSVIFRRTLYGLLPAPWSQFFYQNPVYTTGFLDGYLGYFLLGAWLDRLSAPPGRKVLLPVFLLSWGAVAAGTAWSTAATGAYGESFSNYKTLFVLAMTVSLFLLVKDLCGAAPPSGRLLTFLAGCSFGVYLAHPFAISLALRLSPTLSGVAGLLIVFLLALLLSLLAVVLLGSVKPLCFLFTGQPFSTASNLQSLFRPKGPSAGTTT